MTITPLEPVAATKACDPRRGANVHGPLDRTLFASPDHQFILLNESGAEEEDGIRSNQYLIVHEGEGVLLDPGGYGVMPRVLSVMLRYIELEKVRAIILSHQDPDIVGGLATWLEIVQCPVYISHLWLRFLPHYGIRRISQFIGMPDEGMECAISAQFRLQLVPAHFLHSEGQINVYDPISKILFTGDIGSAVLPPERECDFVDDLAGHLPYIEGFHRRYMCSNRAARIWAANVRKLSVDMLAPQHGPVYRGRAVGEFLSWMEQLHCGSDLMHQDGSFPTGTD